MNPEQSIHESATYKDADIEHDSTRIIATNFETGATVTLTNEQLTCFSVRDLNKMVAGFPRQTISKLKQRRRTLKNRGYAQNCRHKRLDQKNRLEEQNKDLKEENIRLKAIIDRLHDRLCYNRVNGAVVGTNRGHVDGLSGPTPPLDPNVPY